MSYEAFDRPILVCDVDGVVVDLSRRWYDWICLQTSKYRPAPTFEEVSRHYDYSIPFEGTVDRSVANHFWKMSHIYDWATPVEGSVELLEAFKAAGWDIVFASHVEGDHSLSKYNFLKKHFPMDGFMATREKHFLKANIVIDDRAENLLKFSSDVFCVLMDAPHNKDVNTEELGLYRLHSLDKDTAEFLIKYWSKYYLN